MELNYITSNLLKDEKLVYGIRPHWIIFTSTVWAFFAAFYFAFFSPLSFEFLIYNNYSSTELVSLGFFIASAYLFLSAYIYYVTSEYGITNKRVLIKIGWIRRESLEIMLDKVEGVLVDQSILGRILNYGQITIIGTGGTKDSFPYIPNPLRFRKEVQEQIAALEARLMRP